ncbi:dihydrodipicolinate synthase family protein [Neotamlana nanhaiensis]|uniref:dihydrodipicolinate synthase family protein n=1 Tax=Neotamlana nanhaiensis TaxID=1382798 RepID=UPI0005CBA0C2|nr:dihydrodipicolinate synthase family protein [Tamlana nanhaiensis]
MQKRFSGVVVPMVTPLNNDYTVDVDAVKKLVTLFAENNIHPLVLGTTGESSSIGATESLKLVEAAVRAKGNNQCIYAGLVGNQVFDVIERGNQYINLGADCVVATLPSYYKLIDSQITDFYTLLANKINGPVMMYNITATTHMSIPLHVVHQLHNHPNIWGLKDSERDEIRMKTCIENYGNDTNFSFFCGWGAQSYGSLKLGADGVVPSTGNYVPELYKKLYEAALNEDWDTCEKMQHETDEVAKTYQKDYILGESLAVLKYLMNKKGLCNKTMMPPLTTVE